MPRGAIYVGRPTMFGNQFSIASCHYHHDPRGHAVQLFRSCLENVCWLPNKTHSPNWTDSDWEHARRILWNLPALRGHDLACWCRLDQACHGDILLDFANRKERLIIERTNGRWK